MKVLLITPGVTPKGSLILFPGGGGQGHFTEQAGAIRLGGNFLVRSSSLFVDRGFAVAIVDVPSNQAQGMSDQFRVGKEHAEDIRKVFDLLDDKGLSPFFLVGTSRGTLSVAHIPMVLKDDRAGGIVLTSSIGASRGSGLSLFDLPLENVILPVLFVHHREDGCWASRFSDALRLRSRTTRSPKVGFIEVLGGYPPLSEACEALSPHGFLGRESEVINAIVDWILGRSVPEKIGAPSPIPAATPKLTIGTRSLTPLGPACRLLPVPRRGGLPCPPSLPF